MNDNHFTSNDTRVVKGIAILLMFMHHLWTFKKRIPYEYPITTPMLTFTLKGVEVFETIGSFGKICVSLFMFLGGYGLYKQYLAKHQPPLSKKIIGIYKSYWKVFFLYVPIGFLFFSEQLQYTEAAWHSRYANFDLNTFILNFLGLSWSYNSEWWFLLSYVAVMIIGYAFCESIVYKEKKFYQEFLVLLVLSAVMNKIVPAIFDTDIFVNLKNDAIISNLILWKASYAAFFMGIFCARHDCIEKMLDKIGQLRYAIVKIVFSLIALIIILYLRCFSYEAYFDFLYVPLFIVAVITIMRNFSPLYAFFRLIGKYSTDMWLIHSFYCYYFYAVVKIVYASGNAIIDLCVLLGITLISSVVVEYFYNGVKIVYSKIVKC